MNFIPKDFQEYTKLAVGRWSGSRPGSEGRMPGSIYTRLRDELPRAPATFSGCNHMRGWRQTCGLTRMPCDAQHDFGAAGSPAHSRELAWVTMACALMRRIQLCDCSRPGQRRRIRCTALWRRSSACVRMTDREETRLTPQRSGAARDHRQRLRRRASCTVDCMVVAGFKVAHVPVP